MNPADLAYAAGVMDGEGCIVITKAKVNRGRRQQNPQYQLRIAVVMADPEVCRWLNERWPGCLTILNTRKYNPKARPTFSWSLSAEKAKSFLRHVRPYLKIKARQAAIGIQFQETCIQRTGIRIRDGRTGTFVKGNELQAGALIEKKESLKALLSRFNRGEGVNSESLRGYKNPERYSRFLG